MDTRLRTLFPDLIADNLSADLVAALDAAQTARLPAGQTFCQQGEGCTHLALVLSGEVRVWKLAESGNEITLYRVEPGQCCILTASCVVSGQPFPAVATTESEVEAVLLPSGRIRRFMQEDPALREYLWRLLSDRLADVIALVEEVAFRRMDQRLGEYLQRRVNVLGSQHIDVTHQQIAADLGTSREVVTRLLRDFQGRGWLTQGRGWIEVAKPAALPGSH